MIIGKGKPIQDILAMIEKYKKIIVAGCRGCVTVCLLREKGSRHSFRALSLAREKEEKPIEIKELLLNGSATPNTLKRSAPMREYESIVSIACGVGVNFLRKNFPGLRSIRNRHQFLSA
jgi:hypothetical protein